jgi:hypothetical protein
MENVGTAYGHFEHFTANWYALWAFGNVLIIWYIFHRFGILCQEKSGNPGFIKLIPGRDEAGVAPSRVIRKNGSAIT